MATKLYLMRHGETLFNTQERVQGACDSPLTDLGIQQALLAKDYLNSIWFDSVYSSTQERATDTAKLVSGQSQVTQLKGIKEMNFGEFEAQPEFLLPKFRVGANSFEDLLVPFGGEDIVTVCAICEFQYHQEQLELQKLILPTKAFKTYSFEGE